MKTAKKFREREESKGSNWPVAYRLLAMGTLVAYSAVGSRTVANLYAQDAPSASSKPSNAVAAPRRFDIAPGPLDGVLTEFRHVTGFQITVSNDRLQTLQSPGVTGVLTASEAMEKLLNGTGVSFTFTDRRTVALQLSRQRQSIDVTDRAPTLSSPKYTQPLVDTPQTIMVIPKGVIEEQGATTLRDVLRNVPGMTVAAGEGGTPAGDNLTLRGFTARNDIFVDGSRDLGAQSRDPFNTEQVEVTKGPTSAMSGRGSAGGTINLVSKSPNVNRYVGGNVIFGSDGTRRLSGDINAPLDRIGLERSAFRLNVLSHHSDVAGRNVVENNRWGIAPSLAFGLGTPTRVYLNYSKLKQDNISDYGIPWVPATNNALIDYRDKPAPVPRETFYGYKNRDGEKLNSDLATVRVEHDFSDSISIRNQFRYGRSVRDSIATPPRFNSNDTTVINREMRSWIATDKIFDNQTDVTARFTTFKIQHTLVTGANFSNENNVRRNRTAVNGFTTLLNPNPNDVYTGDITFTGAVGDITGKTQALYAFDTLRFGQHWEATGGARWERFDVKGVSTVPAAVVRTDKMTSTRAALIYKPRQNGSAYFSYGTALNPSLEGLSYSTANTSIPPEKTYTLETGTKWNLMNDRLLLTGALFQISKDNARTPGILPDDPPQVLAGTQRVRGVELGATGAITDHLKILGAYTHMDPKIIKSNTPGEVGKFFQNAPQNSYSVWATYSLKRLTVGGGPRYVGKRYGNNTNTRFVDGYWTMDGFASVPVSRHLDLRLNLFNVNDAFYFDRLGGGHVIPGASRYVQGSLAFHF